MPCGSLVASLQMLLLMEGVIEHHFTPVAEQKRLFVWCCSFLPMVLLVVLGDHPCWDGELGTVYVSLPGHRPPPM